MSEIVEKCPSCNVEETFQKFLDPDLEADEFQNLISSSLSADTSDSVLKFSRRSVQEFFPHKAANRQRDKR